MVTGKTKAQFLTHWEKYLTNFMPIANAMNTDIMLRKCMFPKAS